MNLLHDLRLVAADLLHISASLHALRLRQEENLAIEGLLDELAYGLLVEKLVLEVLPLCIALKVKVSIVGSCLDLVL